MKSTITLFASSRRNGNTGKLTDWIAQQLGLEVIDLGSKLISPYDYEHRNREDDFERIMEYILAYEQIIFASPVYWYAVSPGMKIFLDRISDYLVLSDLLDKGRRLRGKTAFILCTSIQKSIDTAFLGAYQKTFHYLGMRLGGHLHGDCRSGYTAAAYKDDVQEFIWKISGVSPA